MQEGDGSYATTAVAREVGRLCCKAGRESGGDDASVASKVNNFKKLRRVPCTLRTFPLKQADLLSNRISELAASEALLDKKKLIKIYLFQR